MTTAEQLYLDAIRRDGTEIARYAVSAGERLVMGRRLCAGTEIVDVPAVGEGRFYFVDRWYRDTGVLTAFVADYLEQAERLDAPPMSREAIGTMLQRSEDDELVSMLLDAV